MTKNALLQTGRKCNVPVNEIRTDCLGYFGIRRMAIASTTLCKILGMFCPEGMAQNAKVLKVKVTRQGHL